MYTSHVEAVASATHSNGPEGQKCYNLHGHDWRVEVEISYYDLDEWGWGPEFGRIKKIIREYDHGVGGILNDMLLVPPSAENFARVLYDRVAGEVLGPRDDGWTMTVTVHEGEGNRVSFTRN